MEAHLPRWDLSPIYPSPESGEFLQAIKTCRSGCDELAELIGNEGQLEDVIGTYEKLCDTYETLDAYTYAGFSVATASSVWLSAMAKVDELGVVLHTVGVKFRNYLASKKEDIILKTAIGGSLESYDYVLSVLLEEQSHQMPEALEDLAGDLNRSGTDSFARLQEALASSTTIDFDGEDLTVTELRNLAFSPDGTIRSRAFDAEVALLRRNEVAYAAALNGVKGATICLDTRHHYGNLARSLEQSRIDQSVMDALVGTLEKNLPAFREYLQAKAHRLGKDSLPFYDLFAPVADAHMEFSFDQAKQFIIRQFSAFDDGMGKFANRAFEEHWIDAEPRKGKVGGAYDTQFPDAGVSRIMCNFDGTYNGVSTMAHELGHAFHDSLTLPLDNLRRSYPMTLAETASIFSEYLVLQGALEEADSQQRLALIEHFCQDACQVCVDILCRYYFEQAVFEERKEGDLTPSRFCQIMVDCQKRTYGELAVYHPYMWAVKGHYYSSERSFYNYPYAFGQLFALGIYAKREELGSRFTATYRKLLSSTGLGDCRSVASMVGCNIADEAFWQSGMDIIIHYIEEFRHAD
ncbi:MAG: M3 family oligoendopeptidase [Spirochaetia bacterium]|jgi:pepF/M3 family oligoendopeptidase|nr:M3 family oligoendopeptidase [Spirochaetia bacterium]